MPSFRQRAACVRVLANAVAACIVHMLTDRGRSVFDRHQTIPCIVLSCQRLRIWNGTHIPRRTIRRRRQCCTDGVRDAGDFICLVCCASLIQLPRAVTVVAALIVFYRKSKTLIGSVSHIAAFGLQLFLLIRVRS